VWLSAYGDGWEEEVLWLEMVDKGRGSCVYDWSILSTSSL